jgi:hypothetical protein
MSIMVKEIVGCVLLENFNLKKTARQPLMFDPFDEIIAKNKSAVCDESQRLRFIARQFVTPQRF